MYTVYITSTSDTPAEPYAGTDAGVDRSHGPMTIDAGALESSIC